MPLKSERTQDDPLQDLREGIEQVETTLDELKRELAEFRKLVMRQLGDLQRSIETPPDRY